MHLVEDPHLLIAEWAEAPQQGFCRRTQNCSGTNELTLQNSQRQSGTCTRPRVTGKDLKPAGVRVSSGQQSGRLQVNFVLTQVPHSTWPFTEQNIGKQLSCARHRINSAPVINGKSKTTEWVKLRRDSAPEWPRCCRQCTAASVKYLEKRAVSPSLGADSMRHRMQTSVLNWLW